MTTALLILAAWIVLGCAVAPLVSRHLVARSAELDASIARHPAGSRRGGV